MYYFDSFWFFSTSTDRFNEILMKNTLKKEFKIALKKVCHNIF
jgi:hypothetical protein